MIIFRDTQTDRHCIIIYISSLSSISPPPPPPSSSSSSSSSWQSSILYYWQPGTTFTIIINCVSWSPLRKSSFPSLSISPSHHRHCHPINILFQSETIAVLLAICRSRAQTNDSSSALIWFDFTPRSSRRKHFWQTIKSFTKKFAGKDLRTHISP